MLFLLERFGKCSSLSKRLLKHSAFFSTPSRGKRGGKSICLGDCIFPSLEKVTCKYYGQRGKKCILAILKDRK